MIRAVIYTRISRDDEGTALGVLRQEKACLELAAREGFNVVRIHSDNDISASSSSKRARPGWNALLDDVRSDQVDVVVTHSTSRLTRRVRELLDFVALLDEHGVRLRSSSTGDVDVSTPDGRQVLTILGAMDTAEAERGSARIRAKHKELAEAGRYIGPRPFGWDVVGKGASAHLVINKSEAAIVNQCIDGVLAGESIWSITNGLNAQGITTSAGGPWKTQVLRRMLLREMNIGIRVHQPLKNGTPFGPAMRHKAQWDAIVDESRFVRLKSILTDPRRKTNNRGTEPIYLLTSVATCGICGGKMAGACQHTYEVKGALRKDGSRGPSRIRSYPKRYYCNNVGCMGAQRGMAEVDELVTGLLIPYLERNGVQIFGGNEAEGKSAREEADTLNARLLVAADQFAEGLIEADQLSRITQTLKPKIAEAEARFLAAQPSPAMAMFTGDDVQQAWDEASIPLKKTVIEAAGMEITIFPIGSGNGAVFDASKIQIEWEQ